jgi:hypothetical protein
MAANLKKIKIFLASSSELKLERDEFRLYIANLNDKFIDNKIYLKIIQWEHFLDAISKTRLQDEYNREVSNADIALCIFFTKVGAYSEEEFNTAYTTFKATGKPLIWTYFKNAPIRTGSITSEINTLLAFKKKLSELGHYFTEYENTADLHNKFRNQLDRLFPSLFSAAGLRLTNKKPETGENSSPPVQVAETNNLQSKDEIIRLIDFDLDAAFEKLDVFYLNKNATYNDLSREYFNQPNHFVLNNFRSRLKRFVTTTWK